MKLQALKVEDFCRVDHVEIQLDGESIVIGGDHAQGKSSLLNAIQALLDGAAGTPDEPIRQGADKATVEGAFDEIVTTEGTFKDITIKLTITKKTRRCVIKKADGTVIPGGSRGILKQLYSLVSFNPRAFAEMDTDEQAELVRKMAGLDFTEPDAEYQRLYDKRQAVNRDHKRAKAAAEAATHHKGVPDEEVSVAELIKEAGRRAEINESNRHQREAFDAEYAKAKALKAEIAAKEKQLAKMIAAGKENRKTINTLVDEDVDEIATQIETAEETNAKVRANVARAAHLAEAKKHKAAADKLTKQMTKIKNAKAKAIAEAEYPIEGMTVDDTGVRLNGLPLKQASRAEETHVSVAIGAALRPELDLMLYPDASMLSRESRDELLAEAKAAGLQLVLEVHGEEGAQVVIEDGVVKEN
jgi:recombinational DNA repair ATPase RecF